MEIGGVFRPYLLYIKKRLQKFQVEKKERKKERKKEKYYKSD